MAEPPVHDAQADLVIVSSPLQYMNAVEQRAGADRPADLVLIGDRHAAGASVEALMTRQAPWRAVYRHGRRPRPHRTVPALVRDLLDAAHRASLERLARRLGTAVRPAVVFGDYRNVSHRLLAARIACEETVLLDDGSVTPQAAAYRADAATAPEPRQFDLSWFRTGLARSAFGDPPLPALARLTFFTIYGRLLEGRLASGDRLQGHAYGAWRSGLAARRSAGEVWLLGSDHAEAGISTPQDYRAVVLGAAAALKAEGMGPLVYRPHRGEDRAKTEALATAAGLRLVRTGAPVELDYLDARERPAMVAALASSAVDTLAVLDPELEIARIALPATYLRRRADHIRAVIAAHDAFNPRLRVITPAPLFTAGTGAAPHA